MAGLRIAMIGQRGVPATFGGIEHHVEEIGSRLAARGHDVTVYCRTNYVDRPLDEHRGMRLRHLPTVGTKHLDALVHSALSTADALRFRPDVLHYHAIGPGLCAVLPRLVGRSSVALTVHGLDNERAKWGPVARALLGVAGWASGRVPHVTVAVSEALRRHYRDAGAKRAVYIPNGTPHVRSRPADEIVRRFGLTAGSYFLFLGRLVPEKRPDLLMKAFARLPGEHRLVIAGGSSFTDDYVASLHRLAERDPRVVLAGYVYGSLLEELYSNALAFVLPSELEGLPLTLLEAAAYGAPLIASDIPPHLEVLRGDGPGSRLFPSGDEDALLAVLQRVAEHPEQERQGAAGVRQRIVSEYDWDRVVDQTEEVYRAITRRRRATPGSRSAADATTATR